MEAFEDMMLPRALIMRPGISCRLIENGIEISSSPIASLSALEDMKLKTPPAPAGINFDTLKIV